MNPLEPKSVPTDAVVDPQNDLPGQSDPLSTISYHPDENVVSIPVIEEQLQIGTQLVETGRVRLVKTVHHDEQAVDIPLMREAIQIERVPMDQLVEEVPPTRQEGDTTIYAVLKEEFVVLKRLRLVEEIRVTKRQVQTSEPQTITLRREAIAIDRLPAGTPHERPDLPDPGGEPLDWPGPDGSGESSL